MAHQNGTIIEHSRRKTLARISLAHEGRTSDLRGSVRYSAGSEMERGGSKMKPRERLSRQYLEALRRGDTITDDSFADTTLSSVVTKNAGSRQSHKYDNIFWLAVVANAILLAMWIYDLRVYLYENKREPDVLAESSQRTYQVAFSSPEWAQLTFMLHYVTQYCTLLCFVYNTLHHPKHRFRRSIMLLVFGVTV